jgi:hypothetical protein
MCRKFHQGNSWSQGDGGLTLKLNFNSTLPMSVSDDHDDSQSWREKADQTNTKASDRAYSKLRSRIEWISSGSNPTGKEDMMCSCHHKAEYKIEMLTCWYVES